MNRFTISLDEQLARQFQMLIAQRRYSNRSEAVRDLIRYSLGRACMADLGFGNAGSPCIANVSYVYDRHEPGIASRLMALQHAHQELVQGSQQTPLDDGHCLEIVLLRGSVLAVRDCADQLTALRGVRHGNVHVVLLSVAADRPLNGVRIPGIVSANHPHAGDGGTSHASTKACQTL